MATFLRKSYTALYIMAVVFLAGAISMAIASLARALAANGILLPSDPRVRFFYINKKIDSLTANVVGGICLALSIILFVLARKSQGSSRQRDSLIQEGNELASRVRELDEERTDAIIKLAVVEEALKHHAFEEKARGTVEFDYEIDRNFQFLDQDQIAHGRTYSANVLEVSPRNLEESYDRARRGNRENTNNDMTPISERDESSSDNRLSRSIRHAPDALENRARFALLTGKVRDRLRTIQSPPLSKHLERMRLLAENNLASRNEMRICLDVLLSEVTETTKNSVVAGYRWAKIEPAFQKLREDLASPGSLHSATSSSTSQADSSLDTLGKAAVEAKYRKKLLHLVSKNMKTYEGELQRTKSRLTSMANSDTTENESKMAETWRGPEVSGVIVALNAGQRLTTSQVELLSRVTEGQRARLDKKLLGMEDLAQSIDHQISEIKDIRRSIEAQNLQVDSGEPRVPTPGNEQVGGQIAAASLARRLRVLQGELDKQSDELSSKRELVAKRGAEVGLLESRVSALQTKIRALEEVNVELMELVGRDGETVDEVSTLKERVKLLSRALKNAESELKAKYDDFSSLIQDNNTVHDLKVGQMRGEILENEGKIQLLSEENTKLRTLAQELLEINKSDVSLDSEDGRLMSNVRASSPRASIEYT